MAAMSRILTVFAVDEESFQDEYINKAKHTALQRGALLGDAMLLYKVRNKLLTQYPDAQVGTITLLTSIYVCNRNLKEYLLSLHPTHPALPMMNEHDVGTIFEALLAASSTKIRDDAFVDYCRWIDDHFEEMITSIIDKTVNIEVDNSTATISSNESRLLFEQLKRDYDQQQQKKMQKKPELKLNPIILQRSNEQVINTAKYMLRHIDEASFDHDLGSVIEVRWSSKKGYCYVDEYYQCCGTAKESYCPTFSPVCSRTDWTRRSFHPGTLHIVSSRRSGGGCGATGTSFDHIPRSRPPTWSCCNRNCTSEGCVDLIQNTQEQGAKRLKTNYSSADFNVREYQQIL
jgi:dsRNA-specific ribonuclease